MENQFANYKNGEITINTYRLSDAAVTDVNDIISAHQKQSDEILCASIETEEELKKINELV